MHTEPRIACRELSKSFISAGETVVAVRELSLQAFPGDFIVIYGPSGSGKTTLLNLLAGLERPEFGEVIFEQSSFSTLGDKELTLIRRRNLGVIFQSFELIPVMSCFDNIEYPLVLRRTPRAQRRARVLEIARKLEIDERLSRRPAQISGGQKQRVAIARTLVSDPAIILGDEVTGNLDTKTAYRLFEILRETCKRAEHTYIFVTHDPGLARYADRVLRMQDGCFVEDRVSTP